MPAPLSLKRKDKSSPSCSAAKGEIIDKINQSHAVIMVGGKCLILNEIEDPVFKRPNITLSAVQDFKNFMLNQRTMIEDAEGRPKSISIAKLWLESERRRQYKGIVFDPSGCDDDHYNLFRGLAVEPRKGDWSLIREHILHNICRGREENFNYLMAWMADLVKNPGGGKPGVSVVIRGKRGTGKGCFMSAFGGIFGTHYLHITNPGQFVGRFNSHLKDALLVFADECFWAGDKTGEGILKGIISEEYILVEPKGKDSFPVKSHVRLVVASNEEWVIPAGLEERRFFVLDAGDQHMQDTAYFAKVFDQIENGGREAMLYDLLRHDSSGIDIRSAPKTEWLLDQIEESMDPVTRFWFERLMDGAQIQKDGEWKEYVLSEDFYNEYTYFCDKINCRYRVSSRSFGKRIRKLCMILVRKKILTQEYGKRAWALYFDDLDACRTYFERRIGMEVKWS